MAEANEGYSDWRSLELAIKEAAKKAAAQVDPRVKAAQVSAPIKQARFDRFLSRVFADGENSEWLLKGGVSMLARVPRSRTTKDVDLAALQAADLAEAERALSELVAVDLGDHLTFRLIGSAPTGLGDNQPGVATRRLTFACFDVDDDSQVDTITVDVVVGPAPVGRVEVVEPSNRLHLRRPLATHPYRLYPVVDQIADKVCATVATNYPGGKRSSRVKDLVDLVVLAHTQTAERTELDAAIDAKRVLSGLAPFDHVDIPKDWHRTYPATAEGVPTAEPYNAATAAELVARFIVRRSTTHHTKRSGTPRNSPGARCRPNPARSKAGCLPYDMRRTPTGHDASILSRDDLVATVAHLLGFRPEESIAFMSMGAELPVARVDLPAIARDREVVWRSISDAYSRYARPDSSIAIVCLTSDRDEATVVGHDFAARFEPVGIDTHILLWADETRWAALDTGLQTEAARERVATATVLTG